MSNDGSPFPETEPRPKAALPRGPVKAAAQQPQEPESDLRARLALLQAAAEGTLDGLFCPRCQQPCVSVWFTHPAEELYRTWFICSRCGFEMRAQNAGRPPHYSAERDRTARAPGREPA